MSTTTTTTSARHVLVRLAEPSRLPDALLAALRDEVVLSGWLRGSGVLADVTLRVGTGAPRRLAGAVQAVVLDGNVGFASGDVTCGLRAVLARETDAGLETLAGEIVEARVVTLEANITALDDVIAARPEPPAPAPAPAAPAPAEAWASAAAASAPAPPAPEPPKPAPVPNKPSPTFSAQGPGPLPLRPVRPQVKEEEEQPCPEPGDVVEHFAFGRCEVIKSDGDRLHVRLGKDGRIKEIALEMLKVTPLAPIEGATGEHFRLDRKL